MSFCKESQVSFRLTTWAKNLIQLVYLSDVPRVFLSGQRVNSLRH